MTEEPVRRPEGFDLQEAWRSIVETVDERRTPATLEALAEPGIVGPLRGMFGKRISVGGPAGDGRVRVEIRGYTPERLAQEIAGFGGLVEVVGPDAARAHLARIGEQLQARYGAD